MSEKETNTPDTLEDIVVVSAEQGGADESGHSSHHHHRHHSRQYYWYRRKKHKIKKFFRRHKTVCICLSVILIATVLIAGGVGVANTQKISGKSTEASTTVSLTSNDASIDLRLPYYDGPQYLVEPLVIEYYNSDGESSLYQRMQEVSDKTAVAKPKTVNLSIVLNSLPSSVQIEQAVIAVADNEAFSDAVTYDVLKTRGVASLEYLYTSTTYYYRTDVRLSDGSVIHTEGKFETAPSPRLISLDGTVNTRDIGGWPTTDGKRIRQGLLYRGAEIDCVYEKALKISDKGIADAHQYLGIVSDFDLRGLTTEVPKDSAFGSATRHFVFDAYDYKNVLKEASHTYLQELFSALAVADNYPIYLHCTYGRDRTGTVCYLLEALLGLSDTDLNKEYELSCLTYFETNPWEQDSAYMQFLEAFQALPGATSQEKAENYLLSCGVTKEEIQQIKDILLED